MGGETGLEASGLVVEGSRKMSLRPCRAGAEKVASGGKEALGWRMLRASVKSVMAALRISVVVEVGMDTWCGNHWRVSGCTTWWVRHVTQV